MVRPMGPSCGPWFLASLGPELPRTMAKSLQESKFPLSSPKLSAVLHQVAAA
ncbi:hypothetical protein PENSUB_7033 [Penicillium subrubescens]|uniref:Uncharacterized protein n=1 Tax=Penicillium subrubescens TaxID=1316194 RepID=A0A1Q5TQK4_9EURO|nr:hypothetical protein PENSUB_7033 [Penicillium subrubescens]